LKRCGRPAEAGLGEQYPGAGEREIFLRHARPKMLGLARTLELLAAALERLAIPYAIVVGGVVRARKLSRRGRYRRAGADIGRSQHSILRRHPG